jgi:alkanesulfonate monooxygenase SsuD/methylene tetrahydromethanopterin reductase-like flavin-dependent oxidoreductase (luciferase family)/flavin reductase (DIM6/NTAB) family NADH-FMN oxidoreductase RutF
MPSPFPTLSVLDLSPVPAGGTAADALRNTIDLARVAERAGYRRYWVAEHHLNPGVASASTPVLVALLAAATERIRVGSGAAQLPNTPPLLLAEQFGTVAAVHPGRVDLGLGRFDLHKILQRIRAAAPGGPAQPAPPARVVDGLLIPGQARFGADLSLFGQLGALLGFSADEPPPGYDAQVGAILDYLGGRARRPDGQPLTVLPAQGAELDVWVLGSSAGESAEVAGGRGLPFAASYHTQPANVLDAVQAYREAFRPGRLARPHVMVSADVVVADTDARAHELAAPYAQWVLDIRSGRGAQPYVTPAQARARVWTAEEDAIVADRGRHPVRRLAGHGRRAVGHPGPGHRRRRAARHDRHHRSRRPGAQRRTAGRGLDGARDPGRLSEETPMTSTDVDGTAMREVLGHFVSGVAVINAAGPTGPLGFTCQSFSSLSLDPPLVSLAAARTSRTWPTIRSVGAFCVNVLAADHERYSDRFARSGTDKFDGGDHTIVVGRVRALDADPGPAPLLFHRGGYGLQR